MDFPVGSLVVLLAFTVLASGIIELGEQRAKLLIYGLAAIILGSFISVPIPAPKGLTITLNCGQAFIPVLIGMFLWAQAGVEDKYRASLGTLAIGLTLYGISSLLNLEPGLVKYPLLFTIPITVLVAYITGKTFLASSLAIVSGCTLVNVLRFLEALFTPDAVVTMELPGALNWNTLCLATVADLLVIWLVNWVEVRYRAWANEKDSVAPLVVEQLEPDQAVLSVECEQQENQLINPEQ